MVILLPDAVDGIQAVEKTLDAVKLRQWLAGLDAARETKADVFLPRFKLDCRLDLAGTLAAMGMRTAFGAQADFSAMSARRDLFISGVVHQAFVEVNEEGTEAAAATGVTMRATSFSPTRQLRVDHPFIFLIRENQTGNILFLGRVLSPATK
jgi:serpin B